MDRLWHPVYETWGSVTIYVPTSGDNVDSESMDTADALTLVRLMGPLQAKHKSFEVISTREMIGRHLARPPTILIGTISNNAWSRSIVKSLRYSFETDAAARIFGIRDGRSGDTVCRVVLDAASESAADCGLAVRVKDTTSGGVTMIATGLGSAGTTAAGQFLTEPNYFGPFAGRLPPGWEVRNLEVVLSTALVKGHNEPPHVVAMDSW